MPSESIKPEKLLPLSEPVFYILLVLTGGDHHGYAIMKKVHTLTKGRVRLGPGTLYGAIKRMLAQDLIREVGDSDNEGERRRYYRLTPFGGEVARAESRRLEEMVAVARHRQLLEKVTSTEGGTVA